MRIEIDEDFNPDGSHAAFHVIHTEDTATLAMLKQISGNAVMQATLGYAVVHKMPGRPPAETRWQKILADIAAAPAGEPAKALGLK